MKIYLREISQEDMTLNFTQSDAWLLKTVLKCDEATGDHSASQNRAAKVEVSLRKVDDVVVVSGKIDTFLELVCSRCATPFQLFCKPNFSALYCQDPEMAGIAYLQKQSSDHREAGRPAGKNQGFARHAHDSAQDQLISEGKDLDITYLSHEYIDLGEAIAEQLQLQVPFQPLCKETCKGICPHCGTDLNQTSCACKATGSHPFSMLSDIKF